MSIDKLINITGKPEPWLKEVLNAADGKIDQATALFSTGYLENEYATEARAAVLAARDPRLAALHAKNSADIEASKLALVHKAKDQGVNIINDINRVMSGHPSGADLGEWFGVEIECLVPSDHARELACDLKSLGVTGFTVKTDGSIRSTRGFSPVEITITFRRNHPEQVKTLCQYLTIIGAKVNVSCGLHVHLDMRDVGAGAKADLRGRKLGIQLPVLAKLVPESRRNNAYAQLKVSYKDRHSAVNMTALSKHTTIEVRLHSGTTNWTKIVNWCYLLYDISHSSCERGCKTLPELFKAVYGDKVAWSPSVHAAYKFFTARAAELGTSDELMGLDPDLSRIKSARKLNSVLSALLAEDEKALAAGQDDQDLEVSPKIDMEDDE